MHNVRRSIDQSDIGLQLSDVSTICQLPASPSLRSGLRICLLAGTLGQGGAERQLYYIVKVLRNEGVEVRVLSLTRTEYWEQHIRDLGVPVVWVGERTARFARL